MSTTRKLLLVAVLSFAAGLTLISISRLCGYQHIGNNDFIEYFTAFQFFRSGRDFYDPDLMSQAQQALGRTNLRPLMMWNPPWLLTLMSPVLIWNFETATDLWFAINFALLMTSAAIWWQASGGNKALTPLPFLLALCFLPAISTLLLGQTSLLVTFGLVAGFSALLRRRDGIAGLCLVLTTVKPHLSYLIFIVLLWWALREKRLTAFFSMALGFLLLALLTLAIAPDSSAFWLSQSTHKSAVPYDKILDWKVSTLVGVVRAVAADYSEGHPVWPVAVIPGVTAILVMFYLIRRKTEFDWKIALPPLACLSAFTSPFGWVFDFAILLTVQVGLPALLSVQAPKLQNASVFCLLGLNTLTSYLMLAVIEQHHYFYWFPLATLVIWYTFQGSRYFKWRDQPRSAFK